MSRSRTRVRTPGQRRPLRRHLALGPLLFAVLLLTRCSGTNSLTGSVSDVFPLDFNSVAVWRNSDAFQVTYYFTEFGNEDIVLQLSVDLTGLAFQGGATVDLASLTPSGAPRAVVTHLSHGEAVTVLPPIEQGSLSLSGGGLIPGQETSGSFSLSFVTNGQAGAGRTVLGSFDAPLL